MIDLGAFAPSTPRAVDHMLAPSGAPPLMLGRERDVAELDGALEFAAQGTPQVVIVGGDAGIGKTTLVSDLERRAAGRRGFTVATGHCLDIEAGMSFAPVVEAIRALLTGLDDLGSRPSARRMLRLLDPQAPRSTEPFRVLDDLRQTVLEAAAAGPVLVVLEDMHWSDRSTQDFATSLSRSARGGLLLVLTFRSDELHRRHPFRKTLTEISRTFGCRRIDLGGLDRDDIAGLVAARTDGPADPAVVGAVLARSGGNPLYAEELLGADQQGVPGHLSDLLLARIDALNEGPAGAAPRGLGRRHPAGHRHTRRAGGTRPSAGGGLSAGGAGRQRAAPEPRVPRFPAPAAARGDVRRSDARRTHPDPRQTGRDPPGQGRGRPRSRTGDFEPARLPLERGPRPATHPRSIGPCRSGRETTGSRRGHHPARTRTCALGPGPRRPGSRRLPAGRARRPPGRVGSRAG